MHTAVDVAVPADLHGGEIARHGAGRPDREVDGYLRCARAAEYDAAAVPPVHGADPQVRIRPFRPLEFAQRRQLPEDVVPPRGDQRHARRHGAELQRPGQRPGHHVAARQPKRPPQQFQ
jgi:hypothetical protein